MSCVNQAPHILTVQPNLNAQATVATHPPQTLIHQLPAEVPQGRVFSNVPTSFCLPFQEKCHDLCNLPGTVVVPLKDNPLHQAETTKHQLQDVAGTDRSLSMQKSGEELKGVNAEWESPSENLTLPGHSEAHLKPEQIESAGEQSVPPTQEHQQHLEKWNLLEEILSSTELQEMAQPLLNADRQEQESPAAEPPLSEEEFQALLDML